MISMFLCKISHASPLGLAALLWIIGLAGAQASLEPAQIILHMLDYIAVDYPEFVQNGIVLDQAEYDEQVEFSQQARTMLDQLPTHPEKTNLLRLAEELRSGIQNKRPGLGSSRPILSPSAARRAR
jgi:high-affinity iron transporter